jgi:hypothetical protein
MKKTTVHLSHAKDDIVFELRSPHQHWQVIGYLVSFVMEFDGVEYVKSRDQFFQLERDGDRRYVDWYSPLNDLRGAEAERSRRVWKARNEKTKGKKGPAPDAR